MLPAPKQLQLQTSSREKLMPHNDLSSKVIPLKLFTSSRCLEIAYSASDSEFAFVDSVRGN